ncbi:MAG TPA: amino acid adenylation domain-containing protein [Pyrinomonadaceae bacterium]|jgi:amino acid adenylation domain-containing protein
MSTSNQIDLRPASAEGEGFGLRVPEVWNQTRRDFPHDACAHTLFEAQAARSPEAPALVTERGSLSYGELNRRANRLAHYLRGLGVGPEARVGLLLERSAEMIIGMLAVLKAGGAYVPLDPEYPSERLAMIAAEAGLTLALTQTATRARLAGADFREVRLDREGERINLCSEENPESGVTPDNLAYVIYTSGSTGRPKGVMVAHRGLCNLSEAQAETFRVVPSERVLQFASINFDASIFEALMAFRAGAALCVASREAQLSSARLFGFIREHGVTNATLPPSVLAASGAEELPSLKTVVVAGEVCTSRVVADWSTGRRFFNAYGPTETSVWATVAQCFDGGGRPPIGRPIANTEIHILDDELRPLPVGSTGELYIGGVGLARGYFRAPGLTAERFVPHPFARTPGQRLYRTGDLARWLPGGQLEFAGRRDRQVKLRGFRIELGDIEAALVKHPAVRDCAVMLHEDGAEGKRLVAYVVLQPGASVPRSGLREHLKAALPSYMVPAHFVELEALPLTPNGKVDRKALVPPRGLREDAGAGYVAPRNPLEEVVAETWAGVLGVERVGVEHDLFQLGAHSLLFTRVAARLRETLRAEVPLRHFFEAATVSELSRLLEADHRNGRPLALPPVEPAPRSQDLPLSFAQERVMFLQELHGQTKAYHAQVSVRFTGRLDAGALERSLSELVRRHEILRTTFTRRSGRAVQSIHEPRPAALTLVDLEGLTPPEQEERRAGLMREEMDKPFDLERLPLIRWTLFRLSPEAHVLLQVEHHFLHDGWSFSVLLSELLEIYRAFSEGRPSPLAEPPLQFADFAVWQRKLMESETAAEQLSYWKAKLEGSPAVLALPNDFPRPSAPSFRGRALRIELDPELSRDVKEFSRREGRTLFMTMFAVFVALLQRYTHQEDICVGTGLANRRLKETEGLLGMIINTVALRADLSGDPSFRELLRRVQQVTVEAYAHQDLPFDRVIEAVRPERSLSHSPLYQVLFSFHDAALPEVEIPGLGIDIREALSNESAKFDLNVVVIPDMAQRYRRGDAESAGLVMIWEYSCDIFREESVRRLSSHFRNLLRSVIAQPERRLSEAEMLSGAERDFLLRGWNETSRPFDASATAHSLFERQAALTPDALAVACGDERLSYAQFDAAAEAVASGLRSRGVGPESPVGVLAGRSAEMYVAMLGILKAGGAYVPLDVAYPRDRLAYMVADSGARLVLTQERLLPLAQALGADAVCVKSLVGDAGGAPEGGGGVRSGGPVAGAENLAYVIYTSGSTGRPNGVQISHRSLSNLISWHVGSADITPADRFAQFATTSFDGSVIEIWPCFATGASLHAAPEEVRAAPESLRDWLVAQEITVCFVPTPMAELLTALEWPRETALRLLVTGGDQLRRYPPASLPFKLLNVYGPTEHTVLTTAATVGAEGAPGELPPIGRPIANTRVYLLDAHMRPVPPGVKGELYACGAGIARGYLRRPALTAERFVPDPFSAEAGSRLYRTGDFAIFRPDGQFEFAGRIDEQVKLRGFRVEPGEIEAALGTHESVLQCLVTIREDRPGDKRLVAYVVASPHAEPPTPAQLRAYLKQRLPEYMLPSALVLLERFPQTANGKIDRRALPRPEQTDTAGSDADVAPRTPVEQRLAGIWAEMLGVERVGVEDNFFELGGHSLLAAQLVKRICEGFGVDLHLRTLFERPTIAGLSEAVEAAPPPGADTSAIEPIDREQYRARGGAFGRY